MSDAVENQAAEPVQLSLADIQTFVSIIDICSKRGAFEGAELEAIGALRGKTVKFLEASQPAAEDAPEGEEASEESSDES
jgi:hypothetical protein